jgi:hypothetical protein
MAAQKKHTIESKLKSFLIVFDRNLRVIFLQTKEHTEIDLVMVTFFFNDNNSIFSNVTLLPEFFLLFQLPKKKRRKNVVDVNPIVEIKRKIRLSKTENQILFLRRDFMSERTQKTSAVPRFFP